MVLDYGFSDKLGAIKWSDDEQSDLGSLNHKYSARTAEIIDEEVLKLVETAHTEAWNVINENREILDRARTSAARQGNTQRKGTCGNLR